MTPYDARHPTCCKTVATWLAAGLLGITGTAAWATDSCAAVKRAASAALAQARIHAAIDAPLDSEALKAGFQQRLMHSIVIDQVQYSNAIRARFSRTTLESKEMRVFASGLGPFLVESGCKAVGSERLAGRDTQVFSASGDLGRGEVRFKLWIDKASGLPLRAQSDEPEADADVDALLAKLNGKKAAPSTPARPAPKRVVATHAYLFGDAVKAPSAQGADPTALSVLQAVLKGLP